MKVKLAIILTVFAVVIYSFFWLKVALNSPKLGSGPSKSKEASKADKLFQYDYVLNKSEIILSDGSNIEIPNPWIEKKWDYSIGGLFPKSIKKSKKGYSLVIEIQERTSFKYNFMREDKKRKAFYSIEPISAYVLNLDNLPEIMKLYIIEYKTRKKSEYEIIDSLTLNRK